MRGATSGAKFETETNAAQNNNNNNNNELLDGGGHPTLNSALHIHNEARTLGGPRTECEV